MIVGRSPAIRHAMTVIERFGPSPMPILLIGATGTGKELFAESIHRVSRRTGAFVDVNCAALPKHMAESLLFGHSRGAYTGAFETTKGYIIRSDGGTLFLDELDSLPFEVQGKILRVLEKQEVEPLGADVRRPANLRVVAAASEGILQAVEEGRFRRDLFQRIAGIVIELPPLAARMEDTVPLAEYFAAQQGRHLEPGSERALLNHSWPGNVRELRFVIERAGFLVENGSLPPGAVAEAIALGCPWTREPGVRHQGLRSLRGASRDQILVWLASNGWSAKRTATALGVGRTNLFAALRTSRISLRAERAAARAKVRC